MTQENQSIDPPGFSELTQKTKQLWRKLSRNELVFLFINLFVTVIIWLLGDKLDDTGVKVLAEPIKSIALFWGSLSFLDAGKEFFFRRDYEQDKEKILDQATKRFYRLMDNDREIQKSGLRRIRKSFDILKLKELILDLQPGDTLYCHDGSISDFSKLKEAIKSKALIGVKFRFMSLAPFCKNAIRRAGEVGDEIDFYSSGCKKFAATIDSMIDELSTQSGEEEVKGFDANEAIQLRLYRSLMSIPFYIVFRGDKPIFALTGFYLSKASSSSIHIEWEVDFSHHFGQALTPAEDTGFISELLDYWEYKWNYGCKEYSQAKFLEGNWIYESFDDRDKLVYKGSCTIEEQAGCLKAKGIRKETYIGDSRKETHILWETNIMHKYSSGNDLCLKTSHDCYPQGSNFGLPAFMLLTLVNDMSSCSDETTTANIPRLAGKYFVSGQSEDELFQARSGRIVFSRPEGSPNKVNGAERVGQ